MYFNPRSLAGATHILCIIIIISKISIHAPSRERLDAGYLVPIFVDISIHAPSRERPVPCDCCQELFIFQSTLPRGSDGYYPPPSAADDKISIHAPSRERRYVLAYFRFPRYFNPRSLAGATFCEIFGLLIYNSISIHAPSRERRDQCVL